MERVSRLPHQKRDRLHFAPGMRYEHLHSNDISRLSFTLEPGSSHRTDIDVGVRVYELMDCAVKRF